MDRLIELKQYVKRYMGQHLDGEIVRSPCTSSYYLRISNVHLTSSMSYLPSFYLVGLHLENTSYLLKLISHHSNVVEEYQLDLAYAVHKLPEDMYLFCKGGLSACLGFRAEEFTWQDLNFLKKIPLVECSNGSIWMRSRHCHYRVRPDASDGMCEECHQLMLKVQSHNHAVIRSMPLTADPEDLQVQIEDAEGDPVVTEILIFSPEMDLSSGAQADNGSPPDVGSALENVITRSGRRVKPVRRSEPIKRTRVSVRRRKVSASSSCPTSEKSLPELQCLICLHTYTSKAQYDLDQEDHQKSIRDLDASVMCPLCDQSCRRMLLNQHFMQAHGDSDNKAMCCACLSMIPRHRLKYHLRERHKNRTQAFLCPVCGKTIKWAQSDLKVHLACVHGVQEDGISPIELHVCSQCGKSYGHADRLRQHVYRAHQSATLFPCDQCDKAFNAHSKVVEHKVSKHMRIRPFRCQICDYRASQINNVYKHYQQKHGFRGKRSDVDVDLQMLRKIRKDLNYDYCGLMGKSSSLSSELNQPKLD